ncbi:hypothetical protein BXZ70DRAFT_311868 [Cristinia sonorae]|uniref:Zn(2)-C6 fungal-type domain-containing protein n=1 Tax=Cristinia sonorae TaxID=1940300 RepID=A0A8K0UKX7_9AGAR|nr:hypothetical protein BXZ70DRAFT_311868 [Cristinia sonorae]
MNGRREDGMPRPPASSQTPIRCFEFPHMDSSAPPKVPKDTANTLKRHQACHQCRKRKMKCDAKKPCSGCIRSHTHALLHTPPGVEPPAAPECTYDRIAQLIYTSGDNVERFTTLETRIVELENLLRARDPDAQITRAVPFSTNNDQSDAPAPPVLALQSNTSADLSGDFGLTNVPESRETTSVDFSRPTASFWDIVGARRDSRSPSSSYDPRNGGPSMRNTTQPSASWPLNLPSYEMTTRLCESFFAYFMHAEYLLHGPSFIASLSYPPSHPEFPPAALLHIICAIADTYKTNTGSSVMQPHFSDEQACFAKRLIDESASISQDFVQQFRVNILLSWYYWYKAGWAEAYTRMATTLRFAVALRLNLAPPFYHLADSSTPDPIVPLAMTPYEEELKRNAFWIAYSFERQFVCDNEWAVSLDDLDILQYLPLADQSKSRGIPDMRNRQLSQAEDVLLAHPPNQIDPFILSIKSSMLLSRVKIFNTRIRAKYALQSGGFSFDPRKTPDFMALSSLVLAFTDSLPAPLNSIVVNGELDRLMTTTLMMPPVALILLHEAYAAIGKDECGSSYIILNASRSIIRMSHTITAVSRKCPRLGLFPIFSWYTAGRTLVRFLHAARKDGFAEREVVLMGEISFLYALLQRLANHTPLARSSPLLSLVSHLATELTDDTCLFFS